MAGNLNNNHLNYNTMIATDLNIDIKICPCCKEKFNQREININNEIDGELICEPCYFELQQFDYNWQSDC